MKAKPYLLQHCEDEHDPRLCSVAAAILGGSALTAGSSIFGSLTASKRQSDASQNGINALMSMFGMARNEVQPFINMGKDTIPILNKLLRSDGGIDMSVLESLPGYQFTKEQGLKAVTNALAPRGLAGIGGALAKGASSFATGLADTTFGQQFNRLLEPIKIGSNAASSLGQTALGFGKGTADMFTNQGNAQASGILGATNAFGSGVNNIAQMLMLNKLTDGAIFGNNGGTMYGDTGSAVPPGQSRWA